MVAVRGERMEVVLLVRVVVAGTGVAWRAVVAMGVGVTAEATPEEEGMDEAELAEDGTGVEEQVVAGEEEVMGEGSGVVKLVAEKKEEVVKVVVDLGVETMAGVSLAGEVNMVAVRGERMEVVLL
eukprot:4259731-Prymnesium_polylepis.1